METVKTVIFLLDGENYGVPVDQVISVEKIDQVTRIPNTYEFVYGLTNLRGEILPLIDVKKRLNMGSAAIGDSSRALIVDNDGTKVGLLVDEARDVLELDKGSVDKAPDMTGGVDASYLNGVAKTESGLLILLNLDQVLGKEELAHINELESAR